MLISGRHSVETENRRISKIMTSVRLRTKAQTYWFCHWWLRVSILVLTAEQSPGQGVESLRTCKTHSIRCPGKKKGFLFVDPELEMSYCTCNLPGCGTQVLLEKESENCSQRIWNKYLKYQDYITFGYRSGAEWGMASRYSFAEMQLTFFSLWGCDK